VIGQDRARPSGPRFWRARSSKATFDNIVREGYDYLQILLRFPER